MLRSVIGTQGADPRIAQLGGLVSPRPHIYVHIMGGKQRTSRLTIGIAHIAHIYGNRSTFLDHDSGAEKIGGVRQFIMAHVAGSSRY